MKAVLITPTPPDISAFGVRSLSAYLRDKGHETKVIFFPESIGLLREGGKFVYRYSQEVLSQLVELARGSDLIGISFMTNYFDRAIQITNEIKRYMDIPVIWGGIHASTKPEQALKYTDMVCIGEGEEVLLDLLETIESGQNFDDVEGVWLKDNGKIIQNRLRPLIKDLDRLPYFDCSNEDHYLLHKESDRIKPLTKELYKKTMPLLPDRNGGLKRAYRTMTDRGCPHRCSYCNVATLKEMYKNDKTPYLRVRSVENVMEELVQIKKRFPFVEAVQFFDDTFFARSLKYIERFSEQYAEKVRLPFYCQASPNTLAEKKLKTLIDAGLVYVEMGIQTGSKRVRELYRRKESNEKILEATRLLHASRDRLIPPDYHIIIDNPWETENDTFETVKLLYLISKPYGLCISSLVFFPGTALYEKAVKEGTVRDEMKDIYRKPFYIPPRKTCVNFLIYLFTFQHFPRRLIAFMMRDEIVKSFSRKNLSFIYKLLYGLGETSRLFAKGIKAITQGDWQRISLFIKGLRLRDPVVAGRKK